MRKELKFIFLLFLLSILSLDVYGAKRYWIATTTQNWNSTTNWSATSGGGSGSSVPGSSDTAYFDAARVGSCTINAAVNVKRFDVASGYTGTISQGSNAIIIGTGNALFSGGTFTGGSASISIAGTFTISGTAFTSTSNTLSVNGNFTISSGSFTHNSGAVSLKATQTFTVSNTGGTTFYSLSFAPAATATFTITSTTAITVSNQLTLGGTAAITLNSGTINVTGNVSVSNAIGGGGGSATINFGGSGSQSFTGSGTANLGLTPNIRIDKSGTLTLYSVIACGGNWTYVQGTVDAVTNSSSVTINGNKNLDGQGTSTTMTFYKLTVQSGITTLTGNLITENNVVIAGGASLLGNGFNINVGFKWNNQGATWTPGSGTVTFEGSTYGQIQRNVSAETFGNVTLNKTTGIKLYCPVNITGTFTVTNGWMTTSSSNYLNLTSTATVSGGSNTAYVNGPTRKTGNTLFVFPIGDSTVSTPYHPIKISAPSNSSDQFEADYNGIVQTSGTGLGTGLESVSSCEYWTLDRKVGTSTPTVSLYWNSNCDNGSYSEMRIATWTGSQWTDHGQASVTLTPPTGIVAATTAETFGVNPAPITIGFASVNKSYAVIKKSLDGGYCSTDGKILYFEFNEEYKDTDAILTYKITNLSTDREVVMISSSGNNAPDTFGHNKYKIDLYDSGNTPLPSGLYVLEVTNEKNEKWYLRFKI